MDFIKRFGLTPHVEGGAFRELYRDGVRAKERPAHGVIYYELGQGEASLVSCVTVPEFSYDHYRICNQAEVAALCPEADAFY